jgi:arginyl-tRNA synthetase
MAIETNLFDHFDQVAARGDTRAYWTPRAPFSPNDRFDLRLVPRVPDWQSDDDALKTLDQLEAEPLVDAVVREGDEVWLRLDNGWVEEMGAGLEVGNGVEAENGDLAGGRRFAIYFWSANSTEALHIGHLRNLALGNALGAALTQAGAQVERRSLICDVGRGMGEAMAGVVRSGRHQQVWPDSGEKSDHFVGDCYADYVEEEGAGDGRPANDPENSLARESGMHNDSADELLERVLGGDRSALELWSNTRAWVISGQRKTLARLGISFDRVFFESDFLPEVMELADLGLREGTLERRGDGMVTYVTGRQELAEMPLVRGDGLPTQHMRALAYWMTAPELDDVTSVQVCGSEWVSHVTCRRKLMGELVHTGNGNGGGDFHPTYDIFHGRVARQKPAVASIEDGAAAGEEGAMLIDDLAEWIDAQIDIDPDRAELRRRHPSSDRLAAQVALGYFLLQPTGKSIDLEPMKLLGERQSLGWDLVRARTRRSSGDASSAYEAAQDPDYRFAVVQAEMYRRHLRLAVKRLDVRPLARYVSHLARWYLERDRGPHVERVVQTVLDESVHGLGLEAVR